MKNEYRLFGGVSVFLFVMAAVYAWWTWYHGHQATAAESTFGTDWIGTTALILSGLLCGMCAFYFWFVSRRIDPRPEDRLDAEIADGAGEIGFFSPGSYWPFGIAVAAAVTGLGVVFWMWWLIAVGVIGILLTASALLFEYYTGTRRIAEH